VSFQDGPGRKGVFAGAVNVEKAEASKKILSLTVDYKIAMEAINKFVSERKNSREKKAARSAAIRGAALD
jgi:hypothetical protein